MSSLHKKRNELELLGLKPEHKKILESISKMAKPVAMITLHTGIPRSSVVYMLKILQEKSLVRAIVNEKKKHWKSDVRKILHGIACLQNGTVVREGNGI